MSGMKLDRWDRKLLVKVAAEGPLVVRWSQESRAWALYSVGLLQRRRCVVHRGRNGIDYRWEYMLSAAGRAELGEAAVRVVRVRASSPSGDERNDR